MPGEGYLSRAELYLLPLLVAQKSADGRPVIFDFGFYHYDSARNAVVYRRDSFQRAAGEGEIVHSSVRFPAAPPTVAELDAGGELMRREMRDGQVAEPIEPDDLRLIYESKGIDWR